MKCLRIKKILALAGLVMLFLMYSCDKDDEWITPTGLKTSEKTKLFLKYVKSDNPSAYYISGDFDGIPIYCASTLSEWFPYQDTTFNALYSNATGLDEFRLTRENQEMSFMIAFYIEQPKIKTRQFPYILPNPDPGPGEFAQVDVWNLRRQSRRNTVLSYDESLYSGYTYNNSIRIQINRYSDNIIEGTFGGILAPKLGTAITVTNGKFRLKIKEVTLK